MGSRRRSVQGGDVEINNFRLTPQLLTKVVQAQQLLKDQLSTSPGAIARGVKLKTPEEVAAVMEALVKRGFVEAPAGGGRYKVVARPPSMNELALEQMKYSFPEVYKKMVAAQAQPTGTEAPATVENGVITSGNQKGMPAAQEQKGVPPSAAMTAALLSNKSMPEAWNGLKKAQPDADFKTFVQKWRKMGKKYEAVQDALPGTEEAATGETTPSFKFSTTPDLTGGEEKKPSVFDQRKPS